MSSRISPDIHDNEQRGLVRLSSPNNRTTASTPRVHSLRQAPELRLTVKDIRPADVRAYVTLGWANALACYGEARALAAQAY